MADVWLRTNRRAILAIMVPVALVGLAGLTVALGALGMIESVWLRAAGWLLAVVTMIVVLILAIELRRPRMAYDGSRLLLYLRKGPPVRVPIEVVEAFLLGQAPAFLPGRDTKTNETVTVVIRIAQRASEWSQREVEPALGSWCDGFITIRGTWCEPLTTELVQTLNTRLSDVSRQSSRKALNS